MPRLLHHISARYLFVRVEKADLSSNEPFLAV